MRAKKSENRSELFIFLIVFGSYLLMVLIFTIADSCSQNRVSKKKLKNISKESFVEHRKLKSYIINQTKIFLGKIKIIIRKQEEEAIHPKFRLDPVQKKPDTVSIFDGRNYMIRSTNFSKEDFNKHNYHKLAL